MNDVLFIPIDNLDNADPVFAVKTHKVAFLMEPLYFIIFLDNNEQVPSTGGFLDFHHAVSYVKEHRQQLIDERFEKEFL